MIEVNESEDQFSIYKKYLPIFSAYSICVSGIFLWGFWSSFGVNIFQYIDISGIVKAALLPLLIAGSSFVFGIIWGHCYQVVRKSSNDSGEVNNSTYINFLRRHWRKISILWILVTVFLLVFEIDEKWQILPLFIGLPVSIFFLKKGFAADILPDTNFRSSVVIALAILVPGSFTFGIREADNIKNGKNFNYVITEIESSVTVKSNDPEKMLRYISQVNDFSFFYDPTRDVVSILKLKPGELVSFKRYTKPKVGAIESVAATFFDAWKWVVSKVKKASNAIVYIL